MEKILHSIPKRVISCIALLLGGYGLKDLPMGILGKREQGMMNGLFHTPDKLKRSNIFQIAISEYHLSRDEAREFLEYLESLVEVQKNKQ